MRERFACTFSAEHECELAGERPGLFDRLGSRKHDEIALRLRAGLSRREVLLGREREFLEVANRPDVARSDAGFIEDAAVVLREGVELLLDVSPEGSGLDRGNLAGRSVREAIPTSDSSHALWLFSLGSESPNSIQTGSAERGGFRALFRPDWLFPRPVPPRNSPY